MSSANNSKQPNNNTRRRANGSPRRAALAMPPSASAAASNNAEKRAKSAARRSSQQVYNIKVAKVAELEKILIGFNDMRAKGTLPPSKTKESDDVRRQKIVEKIEKAVEAVRASEATLQRAHNAATRRNERERSKTAERSRTAASRANNKARGIVHPKAVLSVNESVSAIQAKSAARLQKMMADEADRVAKQIEEAREKAIKSQEKAQASIAKSTKARAELEEKCAALGWRKA